jgi:hypothetical protein
MICTFFRYRCYRISLIKNFSGLSEPFSCYLNSLIVFSKCVIIKLVKCFKQGYIIVLFVLNYKTVKDAAQNYNYVIMV